jgi:hypothetical protein
LSSYPRRDASRGGGITIVEREAVDERELDRIAWNLPTAHGPDEAPGEEELSDSPTVDAVEADAFELDTPHL